MKSFRLKSLQIVMDAEFLSWEELFTDLNGGIRFMLNRKEGT